MRQVTLAACVAAGLSAGLAPLTETLSAQGGVRATVVLRSGDRHVGHNLWYRVDRAEVVLRESANREPRIPRRDVAYVEFRPTREAVDVSKRGSGHLLVRRDGRTMTGRVIEMGHVDRNDESTPYLVIFERSNGREERLDVGQVSRVYLADPPKTESDTSSPAGEAVTPPGGVVVPGNRPWTASRVTVREGETLRVQASGEVRLSTNRKDLAGVAGSRTKRHAAEAPLPRELAGALIGRVGNGRPFAIGDRGSVRMPASGQLFLGINDDHFADNEGQFVVTLERTEARSRRR